MFEDIRVFFKHKLFLKSDPNKRGGKFSRYYLIFFSGFFLFFITNTLNDMYGQLSQINVQDANFGEVYINLVITMIAIFFLMSFSTMMSYQLKRNEEIEFLLSLPVRKSSIVSYQLITSGISMFFALIMFLGPSIVYLINTPSGNIIFGSIGVFLELLVIVFSGAALAVLFNKTGSKRGSRIWLLVVNIGLGFFYIFMVQILPTNLESAGEFSKALIRADAILGSEFNVLAYGIRAGVRPINLLFLLGASIVIIMVYYRLAGRMTFAPKEAKKSRQKALKTGDSRFSLLTRKEMTIYKRHEQLIYYLFYPVGFGLLMGLVNSNFYQGIYIIAIMGILFIGMQTAFSMSLEGSTIDLTRMLPIDLTKFLRAKVTVPIVFNMALLFVAFLVLFYFLEITPLIFAVFPIVVLEQMLAAISGVYFVLRKEPQKMNNPSAVLRSGGFYVQWFMLLFVALLTVIPPSVLLAAANKLDKTIFTLLILGGLLGLGLTIFLTLRFWKKINALILKWG